MSQRPMKAENTDAIISSLQEELNRTNSELLQLTLELDDRVDERTRQLKEANERLEKEIFERTRLNDEQKKVIDVMGLLNFFVSRREILKTMTRLLMDWTGCQAVGIRFQENGDYPYYETRGFETEFLDLERSLCSRDKNGDPIRDKHGNPILACMCGTILRGNYDPSKPFFTSRGSFWTNSTTQLLANTTEKDRQGATRNTCNKMGYESVTLIPLKHADKIFGLIQINDQRPNMFTKQAIAFYELIADHVSMGLAQLLAKEELDKLNIELEQRVTLRTQELDASNKELEAFAYSVSHDLRAPLRAIDGFSQAIIEDYSDKLDSMGINFLTRMRQASQKMAILIDELLELSRISRYDMSNNSVNLSIFAREIVEQLKQAEPDRDVSVFIEEDLVANVDILLIKIALGNLFQNAWKYTSKASHAKIEFLSEKTEKGTTFVIRDNGAGFDMRHSAQLFKPFFRLHTSQEFEGTGIGLATVYRIITRHGGKIWGEGEVGKGATFYFTIPDETGE